MEDREHVFGDVIDSDNYVQHETYEIDGDSNTEYGKYLGEVEDLIYVVFNEKYCEDDVSIDEENIGL